LEVLLWIIDCGVYSSLVCYNMVNYYISFVSYAEISGRIFLFGQPFCNPKYYSVVEDVSIIGRISMINRSVLVCVYLSIFFRAWFAVLIGRHVDAKLTSQHLE